jgi:ribonuclease BN (tRNA processing enzyme)
MSSGYLLQVGKDNILFDMGPGTYHRLLEAGVAATDVTHVFFSHLHYDHCVDFIRLFLNRWDLGAGRVPPMRIYGPPGLQRFVDRLFGAEGAFADDLKARCNHPTSLGVYRMRGGTGPRTLPETGVVEVGVDDLVDGAGWRVSLAEVPHVQPYLICYAYRLEAAGRIFTYSGDSGPCAAMHRLAAGADVLLHMCVRTDAPDVDAAAMPHRSLARLARDAGVKTLIATHFPPGTDEDGVRERAIGEMAEIYRGRLIWGEDLMKIEIGAP